MWLGKDPTQSCSTSRDQIESAVMERNLAEQENTSLGPVLNLSQLCQDTLCLQVLSHQLGREIRGWCNTEGRPEKRCC